jgi:type I restriction enzyme R subunit
VLFVGLMPVAAVEAKRKNIDVSGGPAAGEALQHRLQGRDEGLVSPGGPGASSTSRSPSRPTVAPSAPARHRSGIWFCDLRQPDNLGHALDGWYTPEGLIALLKRDEAKAHEQLPNEPFNYGFPLRTTSRLPSRPSRQAIGPGQREMLLAMATGTGKTKTCIALIYRLLKAQRFRRVLFLVDRSALGEQAANAFKDTRMESLQTFADTFGIKELDDQRPGHRHRGAYRHRAGHGAARALAAEDARRPPSINTTAS